jgi:hypothetical protein
MMGMGLDKNHPEEANCQQFPNPLKRTKSSFQQGVGVINIPPQFQLFSPGKSGKTAYARSKMMEFIYNHDPYHFKFL